MRSLVSSVLLLASLCAQEKPAEKKEIPNPTNLKVLKLTSGSEVRQVMRTFTTGLGVQCNYCHAQGSMASDENPKKEVARHMIEMTQKINAGFADGKMHVTCFTCHHGSAEPKTAPDLKP